MLHQWPCRSCIEKCAVAHIYAVHHACCACGLYACLCPSTHHVRNVDVGKVGQEGRLLVVFGHRSHGSVHIVALKDDGLVFDVGHIDIGDIDVLGCAASSHTAFKSQPCVCAGEGVVVDKYVFSFPHRIPTRSQILREHDRRYCLVC